MNQTKREPSGPKQPQQRRETRARTLWQRLRPFLRRDLKGRLISASITALVIAGLSWFGLSAFTHLDSQSAKEIRVELGLEQPGEVCSKRIDLPDCTFDDRSQAEVDRLWERDRLIRASIIAELELRVEHSLANLDEAEAMLNRTVFDFTNYRPAAGDPRLSEKLQLANLAPLSWRPIVVGTDTYDTLLEAATYDASRDHSWEDTRDRTLKAIANTRKQLEVHQGTLERQRAREQDPAVAAGVLDRDATLDDLEVSPERFGLHGTAETWFTGSTADELNRTAFNMASLHPAEFALALETDADIWDGGWVYGDPVWSEIHKPAIRYTSPVTNEERYRLAGTLFMAISFFVFTVIGPVVTATATAREREAGTLPVLRMTGMGAGELAVAMAIGPNVFALALGSTLLLSGVVLLGMTVGLSALALPLALLAILATATHLTAIGLGDALGQRVNAMVVGGLVGVGILVPGLFGAGLAAFDVVSTSTGLLLGPLPPLLAMSADLSGINGVGLSLSNDLTLTMLGYSVLIQGLLAILCLGSWRRRVEQGWAPLFRPFEGVLLALASIGCSVLALLDISAHKTAESFDTLNVLTFLSSAFLLPMLAWLLVASLRRPARARAVADHIEARRAFLRFQGVVLVASVLVGLTYNVVMHEQGLATDNSEVMWATLSQLLLAAETAVATLLWASRRREGKLRVAFLGGAIVLMQLVSVFGTYGLEVEHVAVHNSAAAPLLTNASVSPYWLAFLVVCWAAGLALIFTALMRRRDERQEAERARAEAESDDDDFGMPGRWLIH